MTDRIILMGNEPELLKLAQALNEQYCGGNADVVMYNDLDIGSKTVADKLFLVGHADARGIGDYDFGDLKTHFGNHMKGANTVYLSGCSTADEADQILKNGFVPMSLASNVKKFTGKAVYGTPGVLYLYSGGKLRVAPCAPYYRDTDIFVAP